MHSTGPADHVSLQRRWRAESSQNGFLLRNKILALFTKVGKSFPPIVRPSLKVQDLEQLM